jgi:hypothetical protein
MYIPIIDIASHSKGQLMTQTTKFTDKDLRTFINKGGRKGAKSDFNKVLEESRKAY